MSVHKHRMNKGARPAGTKKAPAAGGTAYDIIPGRQPVLEALKGGLPLVKICLNEGAGGAVIQEIVQRAGQNGVLVERAGRHTLDEAAPGQNHQGVVAWTNPYAYLSVEELLRKSRKTSSKPFFLMLDHLQDPHNFGSLLRTAAAVGADGVIIPRDRACGVTPAVFKSSAGALAHVPVARAVNLAREMDFLKKEGFWMLGADMAGETPFFKADFTAPFVLLLGSEGKGVSRLLREKCDLLLSIPMQGALASFNVSVAGGIIIYEVFRQRRTQ